MHILPKYNALIQDWIATQISYAHMAYHDTLPIRAEDLFCGSTVTPLIILIYVLGGEQKNA